MDKPATQWMIEPLKKYATFSGRARRKEYWWFYLMFGVIIIASSIFLVILSTMVETVIAALAFIPIFILFIPYIAVQVRRLHDINRSGWWLMGNFLLGGLGGVISASKLSETEPLAALIFFLLQFGYGVLLLVWACSRGTIGENRFGPDPITE